MIVKLNLAHGYCECIKEPNDPYFKHGYSEPESTFLHHVKKELQKQGFDLIKKRMWKDGNMVDDTQQWIRTKCKKGGFGIYNSQYALCDAGIAFDNNKHYTLDVSILE